MTDVLTVKARLLQNTTTVRNLSWQFGVTEITASLCLAACNGRAPKCQKVMAAAGKTLMSPPAPAATRLTSGVVQTRQRRNYERALVNNVLVLASKRGAPRRRRA